MSTPIYQLVVIHNNIAMWQAYRGLSEDKRKALDAKEAASRDAVGAKAIVNCFSAWADEEHPYWGLLRFPSLEARIKHTQTLQEIGWLEGSDAFTLLGTSEIEPAAVTFPNPIYKLWIVKASPAGEVRLNSMSQEEQAEALKKHNATMKDLGVVNVITCDSYWCNEGYFYFGIDAYPNVEANMKMMKVLEGMGWKQVFHSFTLLGIPMPEGA